MKKNKNKLIIKKIFVALLEWIFKGYVKNEFKTYNC